MKSNRPSFAPSLKSYFSIEAKFSLEWRRAAIIWICRSAININCSKLQFEFSRIFSNRRPEESGCCWLLAADWPPPAAQQQIACCPPCATQNSFDFCAAAPFHPQSPNTANASILAVIAICHAFVNSVMIIAVGGAPISAQNSQPTICNFDADCISLFDHFAVGFFKISQDIRFSSGEREAFEKIWKLPGSSHESAPPALLT